MDRPTAYALLKSLFERLEADSRLENSRMTGLVSASERAALELLIHEYAGIVPERQSGDASQEAVETAASSISTRSTGDATLPINDSALSLSSAQDPDLVLCLDFGTAKSKAFAASQDEGYPKLLELPLGKRDADPEGAIYAVNSSVWIEDDGSMFAGSQAVQRGAKGSLGGAVDRTRLDSLKQEISQALPGHQASSLLLPKDVNPSGVQLSYDDAITFYLAYLTDMAVSELHERHGKSRYVKRRFALPCWEPPQRIRAAEFLSRRLACAQVLADTFHDRWNIGIPAMEFKRALESVLPQAERLMYLLDLKPAASNRLSTRWGGLLEPLAAGSSRIWLDRKARELVMVLDVGAGTTDLSLFWVVQNSEHVKHKAFPVEPGGAAIRMAGDQLDSILVSQILDRAHLGGDPMLRRRISSALFLGGISVNSG